MAFSRRGKCPGCGESELLHAYEGTYDDPNDMMCEGCIEEYHDRAREAVDAMNEPVDADAMADEEWPQENTEENL